MSNPKNQRFYIDDLLSDEPDGDVIQGDRIVFEMPSFCSGHYVATIHLDEVGYCYILKSENYFEGCRDWSIERKTPKQPLDAEEIRKRVLERVTLPPKGEWGHQKPKNPLQDPIPAYFTAANTEDFPWPPNWAGEGFEPPTLQQ